MKHSFGILAVFLGLTICLPAFAQNQSPAASEIQNCAEKSGFDPESFAEANKSAVSKSVTTFVACLNATSSPKNPEIQLWRGFGYMLDPEGKSSEKARRAFCEAARDGYVLAQQKCASFSKDADARYRWTVAAALNGSRSAQTEVSINSWEGVAQRNEVEYNHYLVQYLECHPAMLKEPSPMSEDPEFGPEYRKIMRELAVKNLSKLAQCHAHLKSAFLNTTDVAVLNEWEIRASKQLATTLDNIREQVLKYPGLKAMQVIEP